MGITLKAENVAIRYITGDFKDIGLKEYTVRRLTGNYHVKEFMAVDGVSFELEEGDMLGIVGSNGAGKSTLLKAVAGIMEPTRGKITAQGEVAALLELGSGFDGDLTVKENAYLRGAMLGYTKEFMDATYDQIIDFAELREFEDRPFKQLSSGMKSRLAFSIASLVKPDILILDEVLSVGDGSFQEKSAKKMREIISQGTTTILVSHSLNQIRELCNKVLWLDHGRQVAFGETQKVCDQYERFLSGEYPAEGTLWEPADEHAPAGEADKSVREPAKCKLRAIAKRLFVSLVLALFFGILSAYLWQQNFPQSQVEIWAKEGDGEVTFRGASVDGNWVSPADSVVDDGGWIYDPEQVTYTAVPGQALVFHLPAGRDRSLTFNAGPDAGVAIVDIDGERSEIDLWNENEVELGLPHEVLSSGMRSIPLEGYILPALVFTLVFALCLCLYREISFFRKKEREVWMDILRTGCCFTIVMLHCTCNVYKQFGESMSKWYLFVLVNSFTAFAVPCFYMISGAALLRRHRGIEETWSKNIVQIAIPLLFWSVIYIFVDGDVRPFRFVAMLFQGQWPTLWFMYCIFGIYVLLPLLSRLYAVLDTKLKLYLLLVLLFVPSCLHDGEYLINMYVDTPKFALFWPDLGLFFWGMFLWEQREWFTRRRNILPFGFAVGLATTVACTVYGSLRDAAPNTNFISCIGSIGVLLMCGSLFSFALVHRNVLQRLSSGTRRIFGVLGQVSFGVYMIHPLIMHICNYLYSNTGNVPQMIAGACLYFCVSVLICVCGQSVFRVNRLFG